MRILGIDLGSTSIKAVEMDSAFGRFEIHDYHEAKITPDVAIPAAIGELVRSLPKAPDRIVALIRTGQSTFRNLSLPTKDRKAIQSGVGFELEDELPFSLDASIYDYSVLSQTKQGSQIHVAATLKTHLATALAPWIEAGVQPDVLTTESWAYRTLLNRIPGLQQEQPVLLAHIGHERTVLYVQHQGVPISAREVPWGGRDLNAAICQKYGMPVEQAENAKLDHGFVVPQTQKSEVTPEQAEFSDLMMEALQPLLNDLKQTELACKNLTHHHLHAVFLAGGTSQLPGLAKVIEEHLSLPTKPLHALSALASSGVTYSEPTDAGMLLAAAAALCQVGQDRNLLINLRKGEFAKPGQSRELNFQALKKPIMALGAVTVCIFTSLVVQSSVYKSRLSEVDSQLEKSVRSFFGGQIASSAVRNYLSNTGSLRKSIKTELDKQREINRLYAANPKSPIDFLKEISMQIPKDVVVDMVQYQVGAAPTSSYLSGDAGSATMTFIVSNPQMAEKLAQIVGSKLVNMQRGKMEESATPEGTKRWKITFTGTPTEDSYGKQ